MSAMQDRFMWLLVFFDLPVTTKEDRKHATGFRKLLLKDGYMMIQFSVYGRVCNGQERVEKHLSRLLHSVPEKGSIRAIQITDKQYARMKILVGKQKTSEKTAAKQLLLF